MSEFWLYLQLGFEHITDPGGYDHILFIIALCAVYQPADWRQLLVLVTAFTLGHSVTLALATLQLVSVNSQVIEFLIPVTILVTCFFNFFHREALPQSVGRRYVLAAFFGLIHGLGFSTYLRSLLGREENIFAPLLSFNLGLEAGQLVIVALFLMFTFLLVSVLRVLHREWNLIISGAVAGLALSLIIKNWIF